MFRCERPFYPAFPTGDLCKTFVTLEKSRESLCSFLPTDLHENIRYLLSLSNIDRSTAAEWDGCTHEYTAQRGIPLLPGESRYLGACPSNGRQ